MAKKKPMPFPEVGYPDKSTATDAVFNPVGSFTHKPAIYPSSAPGDYSKPGSPFAPPMPLFQAGEASPYQNPAHIQNQQSQKALGYMMPVQAGLDAGASVTATPRASDAVLQTAGAGLAGAATGAATGAMIGAAGGPIGAAGGAVVGGLVGLVSGGIQSFTGLRAARDQKRKEERYQRDVLARQEAREAQARADGQEQMRYNRRVAALQSQWAAQQEAGRRLNEILDQDQELRQLFFQTAR